MDRTVLYREHLDGGEDRTDVFQLEEERVQTRSGGVYEWNHTWQGVKKRERHATVVALDDHKVQLHSTAVKHVSREEERSFLDVLKNSVLPCSLAPKPLPSAQPIFMSICKMEAKKKRK